MTIIVDLKWISAIVKHMWKTYTAAAAFIKRFWDARANDFIFDFENISCTAEKLDITKRNIFHVAAMFFDPLGLISPITLQPRIIFKELCGKKLEWDEVINDRNNTNKWTKFLHDLGQFRLINAPRHVLCCEVRDVELHGFSDSSGKACGVCVFVRVSCEHGGSVRLWTSKCRLAPVKELSIPRLELMACLLLSRLMVSVKLAVEKEVSVKNIFCWTDSQIALWWIRQRRKEWKIWVQNRVEALRQNVNVENWGFVPTSLNPADICTRECSIGKLESCLLWWNRPEFLLGGKEMWPSQEFLFPRNVDLEEKRSREVVSNVNVNFS